MMLTTTIVRSTLVGVCLHKNSALIQSIVNEVLKVCLESSKISVRVIYVYNCAVKCYSARLSVCLLTCILTHFRMDPE